MPWPSITETKMCFRSDEATQSTQGAGARARIRPRGDPRARQCGGTHGPRWSAGARRGAAHTAPRLRTRTGGRARLSQLGQPVARSTARRQPGRARDGGRGALLRARGGAAASSNRPSCSQQPIRRPPLPSPLVATGLFPWAIPLGLNREPSPFGCHREVAAALLCCMPKLDSAAHWLWPSRRCGRRSSTPTTILAWLRSRRTLTAH